MRKFMIEMDIPGAGGLSPQQLCEAAATSNDALAQLAPSVQWQQSYVVGDGTFCVHLAEDEAAIRRHSDLSGFPASRIVEVTGVIDPSTAN